MKKHAITLLLLTAAAAADDRFQVGVSEDGIYRLGFDRFQAAGLDRPVDTASLELSNRGKPVPIWIDDGGDGQFGPGDVLEFEGRHPRGEHSYRSEHSPWNVYVLSTSGSRPVAPPAPTPADVDAPVARGTVIWRSEADRIRVRFGQNAARQDPEAWYWQRLSVLDRQALEIPLPPGLKAGGVADIRVSARGWSRPRNAGGLAHHRLDVRTGERLLGNTEWNGQSSAIVDIKGAKLDGDVLKLRVPPRRIEDSQPSIVDVSLLNWVEFEYPYDPSISSAVQVRLDQRAHLPAAGDTGWRAYRGNRRVLSDDRAPLDAGVWWILPEAGLLSPSWVRRDQPTELRQSRFQADYLMIAHGDLLDASRRLADFHRQRGLTVALVDIQDVYDEFNHGVVHPAAIKSFIEHAVREWPKPAPRFVLLVGDASWDHFNDVPDQKLYADHTFTPREKRRFARIPSTAYKQTAPRALVPTWSVATYDGYAASDNAFVSGDDQVPELAIGRLPLATAEATHAVVDKIIGYARDNTVGPWRRNTLWITNEQRSYQDVTNRMLEQSLPPGFGTETVFPSATEADNARHQQTILDALNSGTTLVHFLGHGGRFIWRTGPPDPRKNHDLFTLDHLDQLSATSKLPVVLSMTCYSAPFDHPTADSIGEKFLRLPDRGAVAVIAASWRNAPKSIFSRTLVTELLQPTSTIGEALMKAKQNTKDRLLVETYNLLGDPALPLSIPHNTISLQLDTGRVVGRLPDGQWSGRALVEFIGTDGGVLQTLEAQVDDGQFSVPLNDETNQAAKVRSYFWNTSANVDAVGALDLRS